MKKKDKSIGISSWQSMIMTTVIICFFVGIIFIYYAMLYSETRENIIRDGELNAVSSAREIDKYLSVGVDTIRLTSFTLDNMIRDRRPQKDILDYLTDQSVAVGNIMVENTTGIYAWINGEYLDGIGWVPEDDYVATERPWYIEAMEGNGEVVVVDPYLDAQTGQIMITLAKTLCDDKSVVATDISMERLQYIAESIYKENSSQFEIILDRNYHVIAHSDKSEVGKNYLTEKDTFGNMLVNDLRASDSSYFSLRSGNKEYIVYAVTVENEWLCLSVTDATHAFGRLMIPLLLTIIVAVFTVAVLLIIMIHSYKRGVLADKMMRIADQQTEYALHDQMTGLKNRRAYSEDLKALSENLPEHCCVIMVDINGLKSVNDTLGHEAGDELINGTAECLLLSFGLTESIYRIGGDEFCVIINCAEDKALYCLNTLEKKTVSWKGKYINGISVSYGMCCRLDQTDINSMIKEADLKMYEFKRNYYRSSGKERRQR